MGAKGSISVRRPKQKEVVTLSERRWRELEEKSERDFVAFLESCNEDINCCHFDAKEEEDEEVKVKSPIRDGCCYCKF